MSVTSIAALIAAVSFAVLVLTVVIIAIRLSGIIGVAGKLLKETADGQESLIAQAKTAIERTNATLDRTETVTASMDKLGSGMNELSDQVNALAGFGRTMAGAVVSGPAGKAAAVAYGVRHAVGMRMGSSAGKRTVPAEVLADTHPRRAGATRLKKKEEIAGPAQAPRSVRKKKRARP
jgi:uncharacterized protein YoxC